MLTENDFALGLLGDPQHTRDGRDRFRYIVARGFREEARACRANGRPDRAGLCGYIASRLDVGLPPSKRAIRKAALEVEVVRTALVDGQPA